MHKKSKQAMWIAAVALVILLFGVFMMLTVPEERTEEALPPQTVDLQ